MAKQRFRDIKKGKIRDISKKEKKKIDSEYINYASIGDRFKAFLTDLFMLLMPILYFVVYIVMGSREDFHSNMMMGWLYIIIPNFIIVVIFFVKKAQTPGCKAYNIKLVSIDGKRASLGAIILRYYIELLVIVSVVLLFIPYFRKDKKTLQDIISATYFIKTDKG
ncbi:Putative integral membrane protein [hydrothermal vent metagenome]|uniref:Putative integral membrane protein n=1 Tax=hydrothermal vent metagenome TaxID=652676 RepID=A0A1W1EH88_9ZZZZ